MLWGVLGVIAVWVVFDVLIRVVAVRSILPVLERSPPFSVEPTAPAPQAERISFETSDGLTLRGSLHVPDDTAPVGLVIFCPELGGDHWSALWYCSALLESGIAVLAFDFRNQGHSDSFPGYAPLHWLTEYEVDDALAAIRYALKRPDLCDLPMGIFGISRGAGAALVAGARQGAIRAVACEGVFSMDTLALHYTMRWASLYYPGWVLRLFPTWHFRITLVLARWVSQRRRHCRYAVVENWLPLLAGRPALMIIDGNDTYVLPKVSDALFQYFPQATSRRWVVDGAKHNMAREIAPETFDRTIVEFFSQMVAKGDQRTQEDEHKAPVGVRLISRLFIGRHSS